MAWLKSMPGTKIKPPRFLVIRGGFFVLVTFTNLVFDFPDQFVASTHQVNDFTDRVKAILLISICLIFIW